MCFLDDSLNVLINNILYMASTNILNILLPNISPNDNVGLSKITAERLVRNSGTLVIDAINNPPIKADPILVCLDNLSA